jgi:hypothetical protein
VTRNGGGPAFESPDGKFLYYMLFGKDDFSGSVWKMPANGGEGKQMLRAVWLDGLAIVNDGIYFFTLEQLVWGVRRNYSIQFLNFATGEVKTVMQMTSYGPVGLSVSPDGKFLLVSQIDEYGSDLMMIENFH